MEWATAGTWMLTKCMEKNLDGNYTRMQWAIVNKSWKQHPTKQQLRGHLPPVTKTIKIRCTGHVGHCWRSRDELVSDVLLWIPSQGRAKAGRPARTNIQQLCADTGCSLEDLPKAVDDREGWRERVRNIHADSVTWWILRYCCNQHPILCWLVVWVLWHVNLHRLFNARSIFIRINSSISNNSV